jgi:prepilin-type N-terminal cleavage/methylation domain-containing protein
MVNSQIKKIPKRGKMSQEKGFTLLELVTTVIIVSILAAIAVAYYVGYTERAKVTEATGMVGSIASAQKIYPQNHPSLGFPTCSEADSIKTTLGNLSLFSSPQDNAIPPLGHPKLISFFETELAY